MSKSSLLWRLRSNCVNYLKNGRLYSAFRVNKILENSIRSDRSERETEREKGRETDNTRVADGSSNCFAKGAKWNVITEYREYMYV